MRRLITHGRLEDGDSPVSPPPVSTGGGRESMGQSMTVATAELAGRKSGNHENGNARFVDCLLGRFGDVEMLPFVQIELCRV